SNVVESRPPGPPRGDPVTSAGRSGRQEQIFDQAISGIFARDHAVSSKKASHAPFESNTLNALLAAYTNGSVRVLSPVVSRVPRRDSGPLAAGKIGPAHAVPCCKAAGAGRLGLVSWTGRRGCPCRWPGAELREALATKTSRSLPRCRSRAQRTG